MSIFLFDFKIHRFGKDFQGVVTIIWNDLRFE